jgi:transcriptional regulator with XRE-family HTH domain
MTDEQGRHQRLRQLREERGWTQQDVADQLARVAWLRNHERVGVNADMVAKWERGTKAPSARYRDLLSLLYGVTAEYLGFTPTRSAKSAAEGSTALSTVDSALVDALGGAAAVLDQLGPAGGILQARMFETWKEDVCNAARY